jgi:hypothetical protein
MLRRGHFSTHVFEAFFTSTFWAMYEDDYGNDWGMDERCLQDRYTFTYGGLCSHNPINEMVRGDHGLPKAISDHRFATEDDKTAQALGQLEQPTEEQMEALKLSFGGSAIC